MNNIQLTTLGKDDPFRSLDPDFTVIPLRGVLLLLEQLCPTCQSRCRAILADRIPRVREEQPLSRPKIESIISGVSMESGIPVREILMKSNLRRFVEARRRIALLAREHGYSFNEIGLALGRHHTTIVSLVLAKAR